MIKKILCAFIGCFICSSGFSDVTNNIRNTKTIYRIPMPREIVISILEENKNFKFTSDVIQPMLDLYDSYTESVGAQTLAIREIYEICKVAKIRKHASCWDDFVYPIMTKMKNYRFGNACTGEIQGGEKYCVDDVFVKKEGGKNPYHQNVNIPEYTAYGFAFEYAKKKGHNVWCKYNGRNQLNRPINCVTLDNKNFYTFKFAGTHNTNDGSIEDNVIKGICALQSAEYISSGFKGLSYSFSGGLQINSEDNDGCLTGCDHDLLEKFALYGRDYKKRFDSDEGEKKYKFQPFCSIESHKVISNGSLTRYPGYEYMTDAFVNVQVVLDNHLIRVLKAYVETQGIEVSDFDCDYKPMPMDTWEAGGPLGGTLNTLGGMINPYPEDALRCKINGRSVDFVFDDLYESEKFEQDAGDAGMACVLIGGKYGTDRNCRHLTREQCIEANDKIPGGTSWDKNAEVCKLNDVEYAKSITNTRQIVSGIAITVAVTVASGGSAVIVLVAAGGSIAVDGAFILIDRLNELQPAHRARAFAEAAKQCNIPIGKTECSVKEKECSKSVVNNHFARIDEILEDLNEDQLNELGEVMENITGCLSDEELESAMNTSTPMFKDKLLSKAGIGIMILGMFAAPENIMIKLSQRAPKLAKVLSRGRIIRTNSSTLNGAQYTRMYVDGLDNARIQNIVNKLRTEGSFVSSNIDDAGRRFIGVSDKNIFGKWGNINNNWMLDTGDKIDDILISFNKKSVFRPGSQNTLGNDYYRIMINDGDDIEGMLDVFQRNGYRVSSGTTDNKRFLAVSDKDVFGPWDNVQGNWLKHGMQNVDDVFHTKFPGFKNYGNEGFKITEDAFPKIAAEKKVTDLMNDKDMYFAASVPIKGSGTSDERYIVVALSKKDADKIGAVWNGNVGDLTRQVDNSVFLRNVDYYKSNEITRIGNTSVFIEDVGSIDGRGIVTVRIGDRKIPFYVSTGLAGKTEVPTGKWEIFWGIGNDGWFNKGGISSINNHYGSYELQSIANTLDSKLGDPRSFEYVLRSIGRKSLPNNAGGFVGGANIGPIDDAVINSGLKYTPRSYNDADVHNVLQANQKDVISYLESLR